MLKLHGNVYVIKIKEGICYHFFNTYTEAIYAQAILPPLNFLAYELS